MKRKYYLRGIGVGILFATIVLMTAYQIFGSRSMSDEAVIKRAEELGMVQGSSALEQLGKPGDTASASAQASETTEDTTGNKATTEDMGVSATTGSETTTGATTETTTEATTEATTVAASTTEAKMVTITIVSGMNSWNVATILRDQGVIEDALDFDAYLENQGYSSRIATGEYEIPVNADYSAIAKIITR